MSETPDTYVHGHSDSVMRSHTRRTIANSAAYLESHLVPGIELLDVGCGPGTITLEFAERIGDGRVVAIDAVAGVLEQAEARRIEAGIDNCSFEVGDVYALDHPDDAFDVVHAHQVLQHLSDPVAALREMRRVCKPGGIVAVRDADYAAMAWAPGDRALDRWMELYHHITRAAGVEADAGRHLLGWAVDAGLQDIRCSSSTWTFTTPPELDWWCGLWADRVLQSSYRDQVLSGGFATQADLDEIAEGWRAWAHRPAAWFCVLHGEVLASP